MPPNPKPAAQRQRRNRVTTAAEMEAAPATRIELPQRYSAWKCVSCYLRPGRHSEEFFDKEEIQPHDFEPATVEWRPLTIAWWNTIWDSPMAGEWVDADVPGLLALAALVDAFWTLGDPKIAAEIRMQQREYGLSPLSRRQLQWEIKRLAIEPKPTVRTGPPRSSRSLLSILEGRAG